MKYLLIIGLILPVILSAQREADYSRVIAAHLGGATEVKVHGGRVDILTDELAIEVDWAPKWKESIGQALWYGLQTGKQAGIILILKEADDYRYFVQLNSALDHGGLSGKIKTWVYPNDFPTISVAQEDVSADAGQVTDFWLTTSSKKRHKKSCAQYTVSNGRYCTENEGTPAGCCYK